MTTVRPDPARRFAEATALAAALAVPLFFAPAADIAFEVPKAALIRFLGAAALGALVVPRRRRPRAGAVASYLRTRRLLAALMVTVAVEALATATSVVPFTSLLGSHARGQGLATSMALLALTLAAASAAARPGGPWRVAAWMAAAAAPATAYGILQARPWALDPIPWAGDTLTRVAGPAGSSVFFAAHLALVAPLLVALAARSWRGTAQEGGGLAAPAALGAATVALTSVAVALVLSGSRGPVLGLGAGAWAGALGLAAAGGRRRLAAGVSAVAVAAVVAVVALNFVPGAREGTAGVPLVERMAFALDPERSTTRVRLRLWEGSADAVAALGGRAAVGYGPEATDRIWAAFYPSILAYDEPRGYIPDRAHNLVLDTLLTTGALGLAASLAVFVLAVGECLGLMGLRAGTGALAWWAGAGAAGSAGALAVAGTPMAGLGLGLGLLAGVLAWLTLAAHRGGAEPRAPAPDRWLAAALLALVMAHFAEVQVGFEAPSTRLVYWLALGILAGARSSGWPWATAGDQTAAPGDAFTSATSPVTDAALAAFIVIVTWTYAFARAGLAAGGATVAAILVVAGAGAAAVAVATAGDLGPVSMERRPVAARATATVAVAGAAVAAILVACRRLGADGTGDALPAVAASLLVLLGSLALAMAAAARWHRGSGVASVDRGPRPLATTGHGLLGTAGLALVAVVAAAPVVADAANKEARLAWLPLVAEARSAAEAGEALSFLDRAGIRLRLARRLAPWDAAYALGLARLQTERAGLMDDLMTRRLAAAGSAAVPSPDQGEYDPSLLAGEALELAQGRDEAMGEALAEAAAAEELSAPGPEAPLTRARALRVWGGLTREEERRRHRLAAAAGAYAEAIDRAPNWPEVYDEAAWVAILAGDPAGALGRTEEALAADPFFLRAHRTAARAHAALGDAAAAAAQYDLYFADERNAADVDAQRGRLEVLAAAGRRADALVVAEGIVRLAPDDPRGYADLAVLRQARGDLAGARAAAAVAASLAPSDPGIAALVKDLAKELAPGP